LYVFKNWFEILLIEATRIDQQLLGVNSGSS